MKPEIYFFDMDHTLIDNDCDLSWKKFLVKHGLAPPEALAEAERFYQEYRENKLDLTEFLSFQNREFKGKTKDEMRLLTEQHFHEIVEPRIYPAAKRLVQQLKQQNRIIAICTSTNSAITEPLAEALDVEHVLATELEMEGNQYTGRISGIYVGGEGKVKVARGFCQQFGKGLDSAVYYGDSVADIPLLERVSRAVVVNPGPGMRKRAQDNGWDIQQWELR